MKEKLSNILDNLFAVLWFALGVVFFVLAMISSNNGEIDRTFAYIGIAVACHGRSEIQILRKMIKK